MSTETPKPEPLRVAELVDEYVDQELFDAETYENRTPLDSSGVYTLHRLATEIYALGHAEGELAAGSRQRAEKARTR